jgi:hypothetical protein
MVQNVFGELRFVVGIFIIAEVFAESDGERSAVLSNIRFLAIGTCQFVDT